MLFEGAGDERNVRVLKKICISIGGMLHPCRIFLDAC